MKKKYQNPYTYILPIYSDGSICIGSVRGGALEFGGSVDPTIDDVEPM